MGRFPPEEASPAPRSPDVSSPDPSSQGGPGFTEGDPEPGRVAAWVAAAQAGDAAAFGALVEAYGRLLYRVIGRLIRDPDDRDDLVQETFVRAYEALARFRAGSEFRPWLLTIGLNAVRDLLRRRRRRPPGASLDDEEENLALPAPGAAPDAEAVGEELREQVEVAFARLDADAQTILWLRVREGLQYDEIALVLGIPRGTVMSRLARAREALRSELDRGSRLGPKARSPKTRDPKMS